jgi:phosphatidylinositol glycan class B
MLTRALSTSPETLLTTLALTYFPLPCPEIPAEMVVGEDRLVASESMKDITTAAESDKALRKTGQMVRVENVAELNYVVMDRMGEHVVPQEE